MPAVLSKFMKPPRKLIPSSKKEAACLSREDAQFFREFSYGIYDKSFVLKNVTGTQLLLAEDDDNKFEETAVLNNWKFDDHCKAARYERKKLIEHGKSLFKDPV